MRTTAPTETPAPAIPEWTTYENEQRDDDTEMEKERVDDLDRKINDVKKRVAEMHKDNTRKIDTMMEHQEEYEQVQNGIVRRQEENGRRMEDVLRRIDDVGGKQQTLQDKMLEHGAELRIVRSLLQRLLDKQIGNAN